MIIITEFLNFKNDLFQFSGQTNPVSHVQVFPKEIQILMAVVEYKTRLQKPRRGVCSTWLSRLKVTDRPVVPVWVKKGTIAFPRDAVTPVIMVGPGNELDHS